MAWSTLQTKPQPACSTNTVFRQNCIEYIKVYYTIHTLYISTWRVQTQMALPNLMPIASLDIPTYLSLFFFAFFLSSRSLSSSWMKSISSRTLCLKDKKQDHCQSLRQRKPSRRNWSIPDGTLYRTLQCQKDTYRSTPRLCSGRGANDVAECRVWRW